MKIVCQNWIQIECEAQVIPRSSMGEWISSLHEPMYEAEIESEDFLVPPAAVQAQKVQVIDVGEANYMKLAQGAPDIAETVVVSMFGADCKASCTSTANRQSSAPDRWYGRFARQRSLP